MSYGGSLNQEQQEEAVKKKDRVMGRKPCCDKVGLKKGPWTAEEDSKLINFILTNHQYCWRAVPKLAGLLRCGKSCRLRWINYLRPDLKRGILSDYEEKMVIHLHSQLGNRWSKIASHFPGRTDNEIKNFWNTYIKKKLKKMGIDPNTHKPLQVVDGQEIPPPAHVHDQIGHDDNDHRQQVSSSSSSRDGVEDKKLVGDQSTATFDDDHDDHTVLMHDEFCVDEVPLIQPHEIMINHCSPTTPTSSSSYNNINIDDDPYNLVQLSSTPPYDWDNFWDVEDHHFSTLDLFVQHNYLSFHF